jgi:hypothetical protein
MKQLWKNENMTKTMYDVWLWNFGMISLQADPYTYSLLRGVTFKILPLSSRALSLTMLSLLETFLEFLLCNNFRCHHLFFFFFFFWFYSAPRNICPFKGEFFFWNRQKSFGAKSGEWGGGCSISVIDFWARNCLTEPYELVVGPKFRHFSISLWNEF